MPNKYEKYYRLLDLDVGASKEEVKKAFRELSHIWHPDNHMGKSSNVQNRANEKFKEISSAYQVLKDYLNEEDSYREAEKKRKAEQDQREREEEEHKYWEEQAKKKHEKEKNKKKHTEQLFVTCPECKEEIEASSTAKFRVICNSCSHIFHYFLEDGKLRVVSDSKVNDGGKRKKASSQDSDFSWFGVIFMVLCVLFFFYLMLRALQDVDSRDEPRHQVAENIDSEIKVNKSNNSKNSQSENLSWKKSFRGEIIGRQGLTLNLERNGDKFKGDYMDVHEMKKKNLIGNFDNKFPQYLVLEEYVDGKKTGSFYGDFTAGIEIEGEYISQLEPKNKLKFKLKEIGTPIAGDDLKNGVAAVKEDNINLESIRLLGSPNQSSAGSANYSEIADKLGSLGEKHGIRELEKP